MRCLTIGPRQHSYRQRTVTFWIPWTIDVIAASIFVVFFFVGLADGSVSSFNMGLGLLILGVLAAVIAGSLALRAAAHVKLAKIVVLVLAVPSALVGLFFAVIVLVPARWN